MIIRAATTRDLPGVVATHLAAFPGFYLTELGRRFLAKYYALVLDRPKGILWVAEEDGRISGFVSGFLEPPQFYSELRRRKFRFLVATLPALVRKPRRTIRLVLNFQRTRMMSREDRPGTAELSSIGVHPRTRGNRVGRELVLAFNRTAEKMGAAAVVLTTDTFQNDRVKEFYQKLGFRLLKTFEAQPGRWLNEYILDLGEARG